jgi:hypothetical protein
LVGRFSPSGQSVVAGGFAGTVDLLVVDPDHDIDRVTDALSRK